MNCMQGVTSPAGLWVCLSLAVLGVANGCKRDQPHPSTAVADSAVSRAQPEAPPLVREKDAQAVLDRWLRAQNGGDFESYRALYADRFQGIKRAGARVRRFDRKGWLNDRKAMFARPMTVTIADVTMQTTCCTASVRFAQKWSSTTFQDQGTKELLLVPGSAGLKIGREEMLVSNVARSGKAVDLDARDIRLVVHAKHSYVVLATAGADVSGDGQILLDGEFDRGVVTARQLINEERLPPEIKNVKGMAVSLYGKIGVVCSAKLGETFLLRRFTPHFGAVQHWTGVDPGAPDDHQAAALPLEKITQDVWDEGSAGALYAAEIAQSQGDCSKALWAREADRPEPEVFHPEAPSTALKTQLETAVRALPAYRKIAATHAIARATEEKGPWEYDDGAEPEYLIWKGTNRTLASVRFYVSGDCGGDFDGSLWTLFEIRGDRLLLLNKPDGNDEPSPFFIQGIVDANQDGMPELLGGDWQNTRGESNGMLRLGGNGYEVVRSYYPPFHDCGC